MIYENDNYKIMVGNGVDYDTPCYLIINTATDVVAVETRILPQAKLYANQLNDSLLKDGEIHIPDFAH